MIANDELRRLLDERGVEYMLDQRYRELFWDFGESGRARASAIGTKGFVQMIVTGLTPEQAISATLGLVITGDTSDGYHTFNELYHHRAVLFSVIVRDHANLAWKSKAHHDGTMYEGMFIVGIETPQGQATYHYDIDPYWDMFECKELDRAPEWDGHTPDEAIARIATLGDADATRERQGDAWTCHLKPWEVKPDTGTYYDMRCDCGYVADVADWAEWNFCPNCGAKVIG